MLKFGTEKAVKLRAAANSAMVKCVGHHRLLAAIWRVESEIKALVEQEPGLGKDVKLICSIPGIGFSSAVVIVADRGYISVQEAQTARSILRPRPWTEAVGDI